MQFMRSLLRFRSILFSFRYSSVLSALRSNSGSRCVKRFCWNRFHSEALSHSLWLLSALLAFVRLQGFSPFDASLFNTLVTSLSKCLAHQASLSASHTAFLGLKRRQFYLSHLPAYFSEANKRAMLVSPVVCADSLFAEADVARLLADTRTSSSLRSQQALVDVASWSSGVCRRSSSPFRSPARPSALCRRRDSGPLRLSRSLFGVTWGASRFFADKGHFPRPVWWGLA